MDLKISGNIARLSVGEILNIDPSTIKFFLVTINGKTSDYIYEVFYPVNNKKIESEENNHNYTVTYEFEFNAPLYTYSNKYHIYLIVRFGNGKANCYNHMYKRISLSVNFWNSIFSGEEHYQIMTKIRDDINKNYDLIITHNNNNNNNNNNKNDKLGFVFGKIN